MDRAFERRDRVRIYAGNVLVSAARMGFRWGVEVVVGWRVACEEVAVFLQIVAVEVWEGA